MTDSTNQAASISIQSLSVGWSGKVVAEKIDFTLHAGEIVAIAGPNGAGKSTLLKTVARQASPLSGQILLAGAAIGQLASSDFARQVAYVPQSVDGSTNLTVMELVSLGRNPHQHWWSWNQSCADICAIEQALKRTGTWELRHQIISTLSGGERQRASIATALCQQPSFLLLDEPSAHLDFRHQLELTELLCEMRKNGLGVLVVLHDLTLTARLADKVLLLTKPEEGPSSPAGFDSPDTIFTPATLRQVYRVEISILQDPASGRSVYTISNSAK